MTSTINNSDQAPTRLDLDSSQFRAWQKEGNFKKIKESFASHFKGTKSIVKIDNDGLQIKCHLHPDEPLQQFTWKSFLNLVHRKSRTFKCGECFRQALLQMSPEDYKRRLSEQDTGLALIEDESTTEKIDSKRAYRHKCLVNEDHLEVVATPYEVLFKNKRCPFCNPSMTYRKDYTFVKQFVEMDSDREKTHGGTFRLLTTKSALTNELKEHGGDLKKCRLVIRQLNCAIHKAFTTTWLDFNYRQRGCTECTKDYNVSYAHRYFEALLNAFNISFVAEYPVPVDGQSLRVDFYLPELDRYIEVDSILHKKKSALIDKNKGALTAYQERDLLKDKTLGNKLLRIPLYTCDAKGKYKEEAIKAQLATVRDYFKKIYRRTYGEELTIAQINECQNKKYFFKNARVQAQINKLKHHKGKHITFSNPQDHVKILSNAQQEFRCNRTKQTFTANKPTVLYNKFFLCPSCVSKAKKDAEFIFKLDKNSITALTKQLKQKHGQTIQFANPEQPFKSCMVYVTVIPKMTIQGVPGNFYIPMHHLRSLKTAVIRKKARAGDYDFKKVLRTREGRIKKTKVITPLIENRKEQNGQCEKQYRQFQKQARLYTKNERKGISSELSAKEVFSLAPRYVHKTHWSATKALGAFEEKIMPYFARQHEFDLLTTREHYKEMKTPLLIYHIACKRYFFADWAKIVRQGAIVCQGQECFKRYIKEKANPPNKHSLDEIEKIIAKHYDGAYYPKDLALEYKDMRKPINLVHRSSGKEYRASVDNFRRKKFRGPKG